MKLREGIRFQALFDARSTIQFQLKQQGFMRTQPGQKWLPMVAEQYFTTTPPAFLWHGTMRLFPLVSMSGTDRFTDGHGSMLIKLLSLITVGNARGPEMDQGELQRYLAETTWFPTAWLSDAIEWQAIDVQSVKVTLHQQNITASAVLHVNEQGQVTSLSAQRYRGEHGRLTPGRVNTTSTRMWMGCASRPGWNLPGISPLVSSLGFVARSLRSNTTNREK